MANEEGYTISITSRYDGWWRYNVALMCGCFDADGRETDFAKTASEVAPVGKGLAKRPEGVEPFRSVRLEAPACDHLMLYIYLIPHTLPQANDIDGSRPFEISIRITCGGREIVVQQRKINQWSGASIEMRVDGTARP